MLIRVAQKLRGAEPMVGWSVGSQSLWWLGLENVIRVFMRTFTVRLSLTLSKRTYSE